MSDSEDGSSEDSENSVTHLRKSKRGFLEFHMGRFCARRVSTYHAFCHWEVSVLGSHRAADAERLWTSTTYSMLSLLNSMTPEQHRNVEGLSVLPLQAGSSHQKTSKMLMVYVNGSTNVVSLIENGRN
jgi:hypothetical protein